MRTVSQCPACSPADDLHCDDAAADAAAEKFGDVLHQPELAETFRVAVGETVI